jgi:hypothetical protein
MSCSKVRGGQLRLPYMDWQCWQRIIAAGGLRIARIGHNPAKVLKIGESYLEGSLGCLRQLRPEALANLLDIDHEGERAKPWD